MSTSSPAARKDSLRRLARQEGLHDLGFTSAEPLPREDYLQWWLHQGRGGEMEYLRRGERVRPASLLPGARTVLVAAAHYPRAPREPAPIAAYAQRDDYHRALRVPLEKLATALQDLEPGSETRVLVDTAPLLEREAAARAGVGWIGKNTMVVHREYGCYTLLGEVLWTGCLPPDPPALDQCGGCRRCLDACPTGALDEPYQMDARSCLSYHTIEQRGQVPVEFREALGTRAFGCDACIAACPYGAAHWQADSPLLPTATELRDASLAELLRRAATAFRRQFGWTAIERTRKRGLLRSLLLAVGNSAQVELDPLLDPYFEHEDPLIREHAAWARERLRRDATDR